MYLDGCSKLRFLLLGISCSYRYWLLLFFDAQTAFCQSKKQMNFRFSFPSLFPLVTKSIKIV